MAKYEATAPDIECDGCANAIRSSLGKLRGVKQVDVDIARKAVSVQYDSAEVGEAAIAQRLEQAGFPTERS